MHLTSALIATFIIAATSSALSSNFNYNVPASANISSSGLNAAVGTGGEGPGTLPILHLIQAGEYKFTFSTSGGVSQYYEYFYQSGDGAPYPVDIYSYGGISGFKADTTLPLVGVFMDSNQPQSPAPATLLFTADQLGLDFNTLSPGLGQVFLIGDGKTSANVDQTFFAPASATRLFLGYADAPFSTGAPGGFDDNRGSLSVNVTAVPEPAAALLLAPALLLLAFRRKFCNGQRNAFVTVIVTAPNQKQVLHLHRFTKTV